MPFLSDDLRAEEIPKETDDDFTHVIVLAKWLDPQGLTIQSVGSGVIKAGPDAALTMSNESRNEAVYPSAYKTDANGDPIEYPVGKVIFVDLAGGTAGKKYDLKIPFTIDGGKTLHVIQPVKVI